MDYKTDDGLSGLVFKFEDGGYFSVSRLEDDEDVYIEANDQSFGTYANDVSYELQSNSAVFSFPAEIQKTINEKSPLEIKYQLSNSELVKIKKVLKEIFG